jgi:hypothetical protein
MRRYLKVRDCPPPIIGVITAVLMLAAVGGCNAKRHELLCDTDHEAVLRACGEVLENASAWGLKVGGRYSVRWTPRSPEASKFPKAILNLAPAYVHMPYEGCIVLEMHGGFDHFGLRAYSKSFKELYPGFKYGDRQLVDGLWYYDDDYRDDFPKHKKRIDAWIEEGNKKEREAH